MFPVLQTLSHITLPFPHHYTHILKYPGTQNPPLLHSRSQLCLKTDTLRPFFPYQPQPGAVRDKMRRGSRPSGPTLSFFLLPQAPVPAPDLIFHLTLLLQEIALGSSESRPDPVLSANSSLHFLFHPSEVSAEAVVLNPAQKLAQTALSWIWWLLRHSFCLFVRAEPASFCWWPSLQRSQSPTAVPSPLCLPSLAFFLLLLFFYHFLGQDPLK